MTKNIESDLIKLLTRAKESPFRGQVIPKKESTSNAFAGSNIYALTVQASEPSLLHGIVESFTGEERLSEQNELTANSLATLIAFSAGDPSLNERMPLIMSRAGELFESIPEWFVVDSLPDTLIKITTDPTQDPFVRLIAAENSIAKASDISENVRTKAVTEISKQLQEAVKDDDKNVPTLLGISSIFVSDILPTEEKQNESPIATTNEAESAAALSILSSSFEWFISHQSSDPSTLTTAVVIINNTIINYKRHSSYSKHVADFITTNLSRLESLDKEIVVVDQLLSLFQSK